MAARSGFMNSFAVSMQRLIVTLDAKATAPDVQNSTGGIPPVFDEHRVVDETFLYMPVEIAKELALSLLYVVDSTESRLGFRTNLPKDKEEIWNAAVKAMRETQKQQAESRKENE